MVVSENEIMAEVEVDSPLQQDQHHKNHALSSSIGRQASIYSLTLDEFQLTLCDGGKNFGSMNMDEFLNSIWTAEENQAINGNNNNNNPPNNAITSNNNNNNNNNNNSNHNNNVGLSLGEEASSQKVIVKQPSLARQGSLTLPLPLCRKTVDEVWSEIHKSQQQQGRQRISTAQGSGSGSAARQATFGEMTLEDFLVKAGVVREQGSTAPVPPPPQQQFGMYQNSNHPSMGGPTFVSRAPMMGMATAGGGSGGAASVAATYPTLSHGGGGVGESPVYRKRNGAYHAPPNCFSGGRMGNGGGYGQAQAQGMGMETASPVSPDGIGTSQVESGPNQYGMDIGGSRGRKRIGDGPVEKVVERRQRRMIKNRESAARSRARKQAYTVELEAELNQLREENAHLKQTLAELERKRKQQYFEEMRMKAQTRAQKAKEKLRVMRRTLSCPL